jgi:hypothetical protein
MHERPTHRPQWLASATGSQSIAVTTLPSHMV